MEENNIVVEEKKEEVKKTVKRKDNPGAPVFNEKDFMILTPIMRNGKEVLEEVMKPRFRSVLGKCQYRTTKRYNVTLPHLTKAYELLNGKKVDDFYVTDIIDRHGFTNGRQMNRVDLAAKYKKLNPLVIDVAEKKVIKIVQREDVLAAYAEYFVEMKTELDKKLKEDAIVGSTR